MQKSVVLWQAFVPSMLACAVGCSSEPSTNPGAGGLAATGGKSSFAGAGFGLGGAATSGGASQTGGKSSTMGGQGNAGASAMGGIWSESGGGGQGGAGGGIGMGGSGTSNGGSSNGGGSAVGGKAGASGGAASGGKSNGGSSNGGSSNGGSSNGGSSTGGVAAGGTSTGGVAAGGTSTGGAATGGAATGGAATGGAATGGAATGGAAGGSGYLVEGVHGRISVMKADATEAQIGVSFFDRPMRIDAFAPYPPELHQVVAQQGGCVLTKAAILACSPPCGSGQYCGAGNVCKQQALAMSAGDITLQGPASSLSIPATSGGYDPDSWSASNVTATGNITATAPSSAWSSTGFTISSLGVSEAGIGLPATGSEFTLVNGQDKLLSWTPPAGGDGGTVQLLLNAGWHGATPSATLVCEAPASAGQLVVPRALVEAYPPVGGMGLMQHTSTITLMRRSRVTIGTRTLELVVTGYRAVISPVH